MKVSACITVLNEEKSIGRLLDSFLKQTLKPNEIVIVDGGSKDKTVDIIKHYQKKDKRIKFVKQKGSIAKGRNVSIELAKNKIIALTDAGCVPRKDWLEKTTEPFKYKNVGLVAGFYHMHAKNPLQEAMNVFHGVSPSQYDSETFLPAARSVAFRKSLWEQIGGFSQKLDKAGEDTLFFYEAVKTGTRIVRVEKAIVDWEETKLFTLQDSLKKFFDYSKGDAQAGIWWHPGKQLASHNIKVVLIFIRYLIGLYLLINSFIKPSTLLLLSICLILYIFWIFRKVFVITGNWKAGLLGIVVQFSSDFVVMRGFLSGLLNKKRLG